MRNSSGRLTVREFSAFATESCQIGSETTILGTLHWEGPLLWIARENLEDGFSYFIFSPEVDGPPTQLPRGHWDVPPKEAMPAMSLLPRDEAATCAGFGEFRADLLDVIRRRDVAAIDQILDPMIGSSFSGPPDGRETFDRVWKPHEAGSRFWSELQAALDLGGECRANGVSSRRT